MSTTPQTNTSLEEIAEVLRSADDFAICGHVGPDGDCIGSQLALAHALRSLGKKATCLLVRAESVPESIDWMPGFNDMVPADQFAGTCRTFVAVDVPTRERIEEAACVLLDASEVSVTIDHHAVDTTMTEYVYVDPDAASASMLIWELVKLLCSKPPVKSAVCAYVGLLTDTGGFRFQNTDYEAFQTASNLVEAGVDPSKVAARVFQNRTIAALGLEARAISHMRIVAGGEGVVSWVSLEDFDELNAAKSDAESLVDSLRAISGVRVACMLREHSDCVRVNLRSKDDTDVSALARKLGGGGHKAAAGITLKIPVEKAAELLIQEIESLLGK